jgi:hypothetical protein
LNSTIAIVVATTLQRWWYLYLVPKPFEAQVLRQISHLGLCFDSLAWK